MTHGETSQRRKALSDPPTPSHNLLRNQRQVSAQINLSVFGHATSGHVPLGAVHNPRSAEYQEIQKGLVHSNQSAYGSTLSVPIAQSVVSPDISSRDLLAFVPADEERFIVPSGTQLLRDAETFYTFRLRSVVRDVLRNWCVAAVSARNDHDEDLRRASAHDLRILTRQAFDFWRLKLREKKQASDLGGHYSRLEHRAEMARDLYLKQKAFSHWLRCTQEEALQTFLARQHVLSVKYFNAWKTLTIGNEIKADVMVLRRPFNLWKSRYAGVITQEIKADLIYQRLLFKRTYWQWFWAFCEARAPEWHIRKLRGQTFARWVRATRHNTQRNEQVTLHVENAAKRFLLIKWRDRARKRLVYEESARKRMQQRALENALETWKRSRRLHEISQQVSNMVDWRVAWSTFAILVNSFRASKHAEAVDKQRLLRNTWTQWNDLLRTRAFADRVDERCLLQALYKWTMAERRVLMTRFLEQRLCLRSLVKLRSELSSRASKCSQLLHQIEQDFGERRVRRCLSRWRTRVQDLQRAEHAAALFYEPRILQVSLQRMQHTVQSTATLAIVASDTSFYFTARRALHDWREATVESKRAKRRTAYAEIKKRSKMNLASNIVERWKTKTTLIASQSGEAASFDQDRVLRVATDLFDTWKASHAKVVEQQITADICHASNLSRRSLQVWRVRCDAIQQIEDTAAIQERLRVQRLAFSCLNRFRIRLIELKGPQATADNLRLRHDKRRFYIILRQWRDKAATRTSRQPRGPPLSAISRRHKFVSGDAGSPHWTAAAEESQVPDTGALSSSQHSLNPAFGSSLLNTPSRRAARAKNLMSGSTTPAGSPFQSHTEMNISLTPQTTSRRLFGRSSGVKRGSYLSEQLQPLGTESVDEEAR